MNDSPKFITCKQLIDFLYDYVEEEMDPNARIQIDAHLDICPDCQAYLETYRETVRLSQAALNPQWEPKLSDVPDGLVHIILDQVKKQSET